MEVEIGLGKKARPAYGFDDVATEIVKEAALSGRPLREVARDRGVAEDVLDKALDYRAMTRGGLV